MKWNKLKCKLFGHQEVEEVFAVRKGNKYDIYLNRVCLCCGKSKTSLLASSKSRADLLHNGWFIEKNSSDFYYPYYE